jgi:fructose-bisphosphate aldolase class II
MKTLRECIAEAEEKKIAIGHFNISNLEGLWGIVHAARALNVPVIIGLSEGEREFFGVRQARAVIDSIRDEFDFPIYLNADHSHKFETFKPTIDARYNSAIFDGAQLPFEQNVEETRKCVEYARSVDPEIIVEAELGYIGTSSTLLTELPTGVSAENMTKPEEAKKFVDETKIDLFAPAVGNIHGMLTNAPEPKLDIERIKAIRETVGIPLVLHGASGNTEEDLRAAIANGISIVHINTEIRVAYRDGLKKSLEEHPLEVAPYKINAPAMAALQAVVTQKLKIFNNL